MSVDLIGLTLGTSFAAGLNVYATVATLGLLQRFGVVTLPEPLQAVAHPVVIGVALALYLIEFFADKIPYIDSIWDVAHTFIRPPAAALLAYAAAGVGVSEPWRIVAALLAGGVALTSHGTKATTRAAVNASPEPLSNWVFSVLEDGLAIGLAWLAAAHPLIALGVALFLLGLSILLLVLLFRFFRRLLAGPVRRAEQAG
jgi:hypothetical protein